MTAMVQLMEITYFNGKKNCFFIEILSMKKILFLTPQAQVEPWDKFLSHGSTFASDRLDHFFRKKKSLILFKKLAKNDIFFARDFPSPSGERDSCPNSRSE